MTLIEALILGIVEGLTEFLPVSSTGHMILASRFLGLQGETVNSFIDAIQSGAILAVLFVFPLRAKSLFDFRGPLLKNLALTSFPALLLAVLFEKKIKAQLFFPLPVALAFAAGAVLILVMDRREQGRRSFESITLRDAAIIGLWQCLALWPGMSRSACTLLGGMSLGLSRNAAAEYSFFAAVPMLAAATAHELVGHHAELMPMLPQLALGFFSAFAVAYLTVKGIVSWLQKNSLLPIALYRLAMSPLIYFWFS